jgi:hypothetical protein
MRTNHPVQLVQDVQLGLDPNVLHVLHRWHAVPR